MDIIFSLVLKCFENFCLDTDFEAGSIGQSRKKGRLQELGPVVVCFDLKKRLCLVMDILSLV